MYQLKDAVYTIEADRTHHGDMMGTRLAREGRRGAVTL